MTRLEEMAALADRIRELAKARFKDNPDYVLDPVSKRYKLREPKKGKGRKKAAEVAPEPTGPEPLTYTEVITGPDGQKVTHVHRAIASISRGFDGKMRITNGNGGPRLQRILAETLKPYNPTWLPGAEAWKTKGNHGDPVLHDRVRGILEAAGFEVEDLDKRTEPPARPAPPTAPVAPAPSSAHGVATKVADVLRGEGYRARVWASDIGHKVRVYVADERGRDIGHVELGAERPFGTLTKQSMNVQNALARSGVFGPTVPAVGIHEAGQHVERAITGVTLGATPAPRLPEDEDVAAFRRDETRLRRRERD